MFSILFFRAPHAPSASSRFLLPAGCLPHSSTPLCAMCCVLCAVFCVHTQLGGIRAEGF